MRPPMKISVVATLYNSAPHLREFHERISTVAQKLVGDDYELVLVNDGSPDASLESAVALAEDDKKLVVVDLSRNFGHHKAMMTGLEHSRGDLVFLIDSDLEEPPELLASFYAQMRNENCDVVFGVQESRRGGLGERISGGLFYRAVNVATGLSIPANLVTARLMTRRYVDALLLHREREVFIAGLWQITGFDQRPQFVVKRNGSETNYTLRRKLSIAVNSITSFSKLPLVAIFYLGITISAIAGLFTLYLVVNWLFLSHPMSGWTSLIASIWLIGGMIISFIGVIGIYLAKIFSETKQRPYTIVRQIYGRDHG
jgi:putative glycosyltransferase